MRADTLFREANQRIYHKGTSALSMGDLLLKKYKYI